MAQDYTPVPATEARAGDEIYLADAWHATRGVFHSGDRVTVTFASGGRVSGPAHHHMFRRAVKDDA